MFLFRGFANCKPSQAKPHWVEVIRIGNKHTQSLCRLHPKCRTGPSEKRLNQTERVDWEVFVFTIDSVANFWHQKYAKSKFFQLPTILSITGSQAKNWSIICGGNLCFLPQHYSRICDLRYYYWLVKLQGHLGLKPSDTANQCLIWQKKLRVLVWSCRGNLCFVPQHYSHIHDLRDYYL